MKIHKTINKLSSGDYSKIKMAAQDFGYELPRCDLNKIREFRAKMAHTLNNTEEEFVRGFIVALIEVAFSYEMSCQDKKEKQLEEYFQRICCNE